MMTKERFLKVMTARNYYKITDLGKVVILEHDKYSAIWFFNSDGTQDTTKEPTWSLSRE